MLVAAEAKRQHALMSEPVACGPEEYDAPLAWCGPSGSADMSMQPFYQLRSDSPIPVDRNEKVPMAPTTVAS